MRKGGLKRRTHTVKTECNGLCKHGPKLAVFAERRQGVQPLVWYGKVRPKGTKRIVEEHLGAVEIVEEKLLKSKD